MKKKGFTLIELLAVIIILAIIALIATPIIMRVIENSKKSAAERSASNYVKQVETLIVAERLSGNPISDGVYELDNNGDICLDNECNKTLVVTMTGTKPSSGRIQIENEKVTAYSINVEDQESKYGVFTKLPAKYQKVEYIESTGTQYIDTGVIIDANSKIEIEFSFIKLNSDYVVLGMADWSISAVLQVFTSGATIGIANPKFSSQKNISEDTNIHRATIDNKNKQNIIDDSVQKYTDNFSKTNKSLYLFARNQGNAALPSWAKVYYLKIYDDDIITRSFIPCYSKTTVTDVNGNECSEGTIGLYDLVSGEFYTNQGSGNFEKGDNV